MSTEWAARRSRDGEVELMIVAILRLRLSWRKWYGVLLKIGAVVTKSTQLKAAPSQFVLWDWEQIVDCWTTTTAAEWISVVYNLPQPDKVNRKGEMKRGKQGVHPGLGYHQYADCPDWRRKWPVAGFQPSGMACIGRNTTRKGPCTDEHYNLHLYSFAHHTELFSWPKI